MRIFAGLAFAAFMMVANVSAATMYVVGTCGTFSNPAPNSPLSGTWVCPTAASLGITGSITLASEFVSYDSDYSNGLNASVTTVTKWSFTGAGLAFATDTTTSTGGGNSSPAISSDGLTLNPFVSLPPVLLPGFYNNVGIPFGTVTVNWTNQATVGSAIQATGYAQIVYDYNTVVAGTPEPVSMLLLGSGLLAVSLIGRKKLARK
jgi:hypothetical protein